MTNQMQGEILFQGWSGTTAADWAYTPWMPVRGDYATFGIEVVAIAGGATLEWEVETRTAENGPANQIFSSVQSRNAVGVGQHMNNFACKQMVRYRFRVPGTASTSIYVIFRALAPSWQADR